jgi:hypothetical protein
MKNQGHQTKQQAEEPPIYISGFFLIWTFRLLMDSLSIQLSLPGRK